MDSPQDLEMEEALKQVMPALPPAIRHYFAEGRLIPVVRGLVSKYGIRIDQAGILEREVMLLLMGLETSTEFVEALAEEAKIDDETIGKIVQDINEQIFIPLRAEMEHGAATAVQPAQSVARPVVAAAPEQPPPPPPAAKSSSLPPQYVPEYPQGIYAPPPQSPRYQQQENAAAYIHHVAPLPKQSPVNKIQPTPAKPAPVVSPKPQEITDRARLLEDREEPHINFPAPPRAAARTAPPPPNLPGTFPEHSVPVAEPIVQKPLQTRPYSVDPYREPIDEAK